MIVMIMIITVTILTLKTPAAEAQPLLGPDAAVAEAKRAARGRQNKHFAKQG